ncbi:MAG: isoprenylcysteine carboxylmethyltransferase family protein [Rhodobacterales bacterium]|nr:isoprenylcysteine carboxylmethyltransferase family protein [Rhodobacterales bacterium]
MLKWIDLPPVWLALAALGAWGQATYFPMDLSFGGAWADFAGGIFIGGGLILMALAFVEMRKHRTTVIPHLNANALVSSGIFSRTRNPIYVGDALVLAGLILRWDAVLALPLVPIFILVIEKRFIIGEEDRLRRKFRSQFAAYCEKTRRWV